MIEDLDFASNFEYDGQINHPSNTNLLLDSNLNSNVDASLSYSSNEDLYFHVNMIHIVLPSLKQL